MSRPASPILLLPIAALFALAVLLPAAAPARAATPEELAASLEAEGFSCTRDDGFICDTLELPPNTWMIFTASDQQSPWPVGQATSGVPGADPYPADFARRTRALVEVICAPALAIYDASVADALAQPWPSSVTRTAGDCHLDIEVGRVPDTGDTVINQIDITIEARPGGSAPTSPGAGLGEAASAIVSDLEAAGFTCIFSGDGAQCTRDTGPGEQMVLEVTGTEAYAQLGAGSSASFGEAYTDEFGGFARRIVEVVCEPALDLFDATLAEVLAQPRPADGAPISVQRSTPGGECDLTVDRDGLETDRGTQEGLSFSIFRLVRFSPAPTEGAPGPTAAPSPGSGPGASAPPTAVPGAEANGGPPDVPGDARPAFASALAGPSAVVTDLPTIAISVVLALLVVLLMPFPAALFNSTLEENYDEVRGWFRLAPRSAKPAAAVTPGQASVRGLWERWPGVALFLLLSAVLYGFLDPEFGTGASTPAMYLGTLVGLVLVTAMASWLPVLTHAREGDRPRFRALPLSLLVGVACVLISRVTGFLPGYLYGLIVTLEFAKAFDERREGRTAAAAAAFLLGVAAVAWLLLEWIRAIAGSDAGFVTSVAETALASVVVAGVEGVVFSAIPIRFLPGAAILRWSRPAWAALYGAGVFAFLHILLNPSSGYLASTERTPLVTTLALLVGFGLVSVAFWGWFRFRRAPEAA